MERIEWFELDTLRLTALHVPAGADGRQEKMVGIEVMARLTWPGGQEPEPKRMPLVLVPPRLLPDVLQLLQQRVAEEFPGLADDGAQAPQSTH